MFQFLEALAEDDWEPYTALLLCAAAATAVAILISACHIAAVLGSPLAPRERVLVARVVGLVPITAVNAFVGLLEHFGQVETRLIDDLLDACKEAYEALDGRRPNCSKSH